MSNRALILWSLGLTLPFQFLYIAASLMVSGGGSPACSNFHSSSLTPCSFGEMLGNALFAVLLVNLLSYGIFFVVSACVIAFVFAVVRKLRAPAATSSWRNPWWRLW